jgi:hypothetical protein
LLLYLFFLVLLAFPLLFSSPYSYPLHFLSFSCAAIHCSPLQLPFLPLLIHTFQYICLLLLSFPNLSPHFLSLLHIHHRLTRLPYQPYTPDTPCNPWHNHLPLQQWKYT